MTNKMAARDFFYAQGSPSYGNSKGAKLKMLMKKIIFPSLRVSRFFKCGKEWYYFQQKLMKSKIVVHLDCFIVSFAMGL